VLVLVQPPTILTRCRDLTVLLYSASVFFSAFLFPFSMFAPTFPPTTKKHRSAIDDPQVTKVLILSAKDDATE